MDLAIPPATSRDTEEKTDSQPANEGSFFSELGNLFTGGHINASAGIQYSDKNFGRDSAVSMLFLLDALKHTTNPRNQKEARYIIEQATKSLVYWQGQKDAKIGERWRRDAEEPGKIHHEAGPVEIDTIGLVDKWQEEDDKNSKTLVYFGSVDSTPLFVRLVCEYVEELKRQDNSGHSAYSFLLSRVYNFRGVHLTIVESLLAALGWIERELEDSDLGLVEYQRRPGQEKGLTNQTWKDSLTSYVHENGELANTSSPVASIEVQALAYDALAGAAKLFETDKILASSAGVHDDKIASWRDVAEKLRGSIVKNFWLEDQQRFAQALDRDPATGSPRPLKTPSSNELQLLNSRLFDDLPKTEKQKYVESLARAAVSKEFLTDVGIRCRAKSQAGLIDFADYHGSWASWPWDSHWIALGLRRQGFASLADEVDTRILNAFTVAGDYLEYFLVDPKNDEAYYRFQPLEWDSREPAPDGAISASTIPDTPQTWSLTAAIGIRAIMSSAQPAQPIDDIWQAALEKELLLNTKHISVLTEGAEISKMREASPVASIDRRSGREADLRYHEKAGTPAPVLLPAV